MKKALLCALEMVQEWALESEKLLVAAWKTKKTLVWANETFRDYAPKFMGKAMLIADETVGAKEPESERLLAAVCAKGKALVRVVVMVRE